MLLSQSLSIPRTGQQSFFPTGKTSYSDANFLAKTMRHSLVLANAGVNMTEKGLDTFGDLPTFLKGIGIQLLSHKDLE